MELNIITASFNGQRTIYTKPVYQYNYGQVLQITGLNLPMAFEAHFTGVEKGKTVPVIGSCEDGIGIVSVPDESLKKNDDIVCYIFLHETEDDGETVYKIITRIMSREEPTDIEPTPVQQDAITQAIGALQNAVRKTGQDVETTNANAELTHDYRDEAKQAKTQAVSAKEDAILAKTQAETARDTALTHANSASSSATSASQSAQMALTEADRAKTEADRAKTEADKAKTSAESIIGSVSRVSEYAEQAKQSATKAQTKATQAETSATEAVNAKNGAVTAKTQAESFATSASASATTATTKAIEASNSATTAVNAKNDAESAKNVAVTTAEAIQNALVRTAIHDTASGAVATFPDGADNLPMDSVVCKIEPVQDLHGYDNPWPAGGGKNKLPMLTAPQTISGVTATPNADGSITLTGASDKIVYFDLDTDFDSTKYAGYVITGLPTSGSWNTNNVMFRICSADSRDSLQDIITINGRYVTNVVVDNGKNLRFSIRVVGKYTIPSGGLTLKPMLREPSESDTFAPYSNICPITGWTGAKVTRTGVNVWDEEWELGAYNSSTGAKVSSTTRIRTKNPIRVIPKTDYCFTYDAAELRVQMYDANMNFLREAYRNRSQSGQALTLAENCHYITFSVGNSSYPVTTYNHDISINYPSTATAYEPYAGNTYDITFPTEAGTVYGGTLDVTKGTLTVDSAMVTLDGDEHWYTYSASSYDSYCFTTDVPNKKIKGLASISNTYKNVKAAWGDGGNGKYGVFSDHGSLARWYFTRPNAEFEKNLTAWKSWLAENPLQVCYELATPITYQLTPQQINTLLGTNNVWSDTGDSDVEYPADTKLYIDKKLG